MLVSIPPICQPYLSAALVRVRYLYPHVRFEEVLDDAVCFDGHAQAEERVIAREVLYSVYREKIYNETLPLRTALLNAVLRS